MYHRARQFDKARPLYRRLLLIDPQNRDGFNNFLVLLADEAPREALVEMGKLETANPGFSNIPAQMAVIYEKIGDQDKAIGKMFRAVELAPENLTYRYNLAIMLDKQKNYDEAAKLYRQLIEAAARGEKIPGNVDNIQQRLTFISSNRP
jgi:tetratricopeptide (TPR) repeat protein